jgi:hypothetical protein
MPFRRPLRLLSQAHPRLFRQFQVGILGSCASACNPSYLAPLCNVAGLTSPVPFRGRSRESAVALRRRLSALLAAVLMAVMMFAVAGPASALPQGQGGG